MFNSTPTSRTYTHMYQHQSQQHLKKQDQVQSFNFHDSSSSRYGVYDICRRCEVCFGTLPWKYVAVVALTVVLLSIVSSWNHHHHHVIINGSHVTTGPTVIPAQFANVDEEFMDTSLSDEWDGLQNHANDHGAVTNLRRVPRFRVDLEAPPSQRWTSLITAYKDRLSPLRAFLRDTANLLSLQMGITPFQFQQRIRKVFEATKHSWSDLVDVEELRGIAAADGRLSVEDVMLLQLLVDSNALGTSLVVPMDIGDVLVHGRTLDWKQEFLARIAVEIDFQRDHRTVFRGATFVGYVGVLIGTRPQSPVLAVSINARQPSSHKPWESVFSRVIRGAVPAGIAARHILHGSASAAKNQSLFDSCVNQASSLPLAQPVYLCLSSNKAPDGVSVARDPIPFSLNRTTRLVGNDDDGGDGSSIDTDDDDAVMMDDAIVQANVDTWEDAPLHANEMNSRGRVQHVRTKLQRSQFSLYTEKDVWRLLAAYPVFTDATVFVSVINSQGHLETRHRSL